MNDYSDFSSHGYQVERILGRNPTGGRVTYLATQISTHQPVVVKQYQFAQSGLSWNGYLAYQSEIKILRSLYCHNIPRYIDSFETDTGFCLIQEYKNAPSLEPSRQYTPEQIKQIAIAILDILVYLQKQVPPVIHGDLKPENILIDPNDPSKVYLVDFGFARMGSGDVAFSNVIKGTLGFMPPEEMFNRMLTKASDLYSLGVTLICLLTITPSKDISNLIDEKTYQLRYKHQLPKLHPQFLQWLDKMVAPSVSDRYSNAQAALTALQSLSIIGGFSVLKAFKGEKLASKTLAFGACALIIAIATSIGGIIYWQGRHVRQLLQSNACQSCDLKSVNLTKAELEKANLQGANLQSADLKGSNLTSVNLQGANLQGAVLEGVDLTNSNLEGALLQGAKLMGANLKGANLEGANLENAILSDANLADVNLKYANLINTKFRYTKLTNATLEGANLGGTDLEGSILQGATMPDGKKNP